MDEAGDKEDAVLDSHRSSEKTAHSEHSADIQQSFQIRPPADSKFRPSAVQEHLNSILSELLSGKKYSEDETEVLTKSVANTIRNRIKDREFKRYRFVVQVVIGEKRGAGVKVGARCLWDADTDNYETLFCVAAVFAVYTY